MSLGGGEGGGLALNNQETLPCRTRVFSLIPSASYYFENNVDIYWQAVLA